MIYNFFGFWDFGSKHGQRQNSEETMLLCSYRYSHREFQASPTTFGNWPGNQFLKIVSTAPPKEDFKHNYICDPFADL